LSGSGLNDPFLILSVTILLNRFDTSLETSPRLQGKPYRALYSSWVVPWTICRWPFKVPRSSPQRRHWMPSRFEKYSSISCFVRNLPTQGNPGTEEVSRCFCGICFALLSSVQASKYNMTKKCSVFLDLREDRTVMA
jgi:hypothetical protein